MEKCNVNTKKNVIFDFDGTLVDAHGQYTAALKEYSEARGLPWNSEKMALGYTTPQISDLGWGVSIAQQQELLDGLNDFYFQEMVNHGRFMPEIFPDTIAVLDQIGAEYDMTVITARDRNSLLAVFRHYGLDKYFSAYRSLCCARDRGYPIKPAGDSVHCVLKDTRHALQDVVVVGDTISDIGMANNAGVKSIAALWGVHPRDRLEAQNPTVILENLIDLPQAVVDVFKR